MDFCDDSVKSRIFNKTEGGTDEITLAFSLWSELFHWCHLLHKGHKITILPK